MTQFRKPLLAGVCAALVAGLMSASAASAEEPVEKVAKQVDKFSKDQQKRYYREVIPGFKKIEKAGDKWRELGDRALGLKLVGLKAIKKVIKKVRKKVRKLAVEGIYGSPKTRRTQGGTRRNPNRQPAPGSLRLRRYPNDVVPRRPLTNRERMYHKTFVPSPVFRDLEKSRRANVSRPQRIAPVSKPKGVLMRLGIDPKTYRRGSSSKSLLNRIRSRSS